MLLDLMNNVPPTPEQVRLIARAAAMAGEGAEAYYYLSEYRLMTGDLVGGVNYLRQALAMPELQEIQRIRFEARIDFIREFMTEEQLTQLAAQPPGRSHREHGPIVRSELRFSHSLALLLLVVAGSLTGCATHDPLDENSTYVEYDPLEPLNRKVHSFNMAWTKSHWPPRPRLPQGPAHAGAPQRHEFLQQPDDATIGAE